MDPATARAAARAALVAAAGRSTVSSSAGGPAGTAFAPAARGDGHSTVAARSTGSALPSARPGRP
ncbi:hypothetical protein ACFWVF_32560 [Streptomyces sp. NPDC058659]|uniref:hypothetical protein n=1 Tax=unclassified Streptomyces TaxID=2593676 RepID=UPI00365CCB3F